jgi:heme exporter protein C
LSAWVAVIGVINVPIVRFSVDWWNSLHQTPSVMKLERASMPASMLVPLLTMFLGVTIFFLAILAVRLRAEILQRERGASWVRELLGKTAK